jgi:hypothetical protein
MPRLRTLVALTLVLVLAGCNFPGINPSAITPAPVPEGTLPLPAATEGPVLPSSPALPEEAILILEPGPGSRLVDVVHVAGMADPTFEQFLGIRIILDDGTVTAQTSTTIQADWGIRGPFAVDVPFTVSGERNAFIQVFADSPRDGGIIHLNSVGVILAEAGPASLVPASPHPEDIIITLPASGSTVSGGVAHVEGIGIASFEQTLSISITNAEGTTIATLPVIVNAPDYGLPGSFSLDLAYSVAGEQPGRIVVRDPSVVFAGENHLASVEVNLAP